MAVYLAVCALRRGLRPALLDLDPQETAFTWNERRPSDRKLHAVWTSAAHTGELLAKADAAGFDLAIIDTAPHSSLEAAQVAQAADLVLIPCRPAGLDLDAIASTMRIAKAAEANCAVVLNAAPRGKLAEEARAILTRSGVTVLPPGRTDRLPTVRPSQMAALCRNVSSTDRLP